MAERTCGGCTACCKTHLVESIEKPPMTWCPLCKIGTGCSVYGSASQPQECKDFRCQWLMGYGEEKDRPDCTGIVIDYSFNSVLEAKVAHLWEESNHTLQGTYFKDVLRDLMWRELPIMLIYFDCRHELLLPLGFKISQAAFDTFTEDEVLMQHYSTL